MEPRKTTNIALLLGGGFMYNFLFDHENLGMNLIIFSFFLILIGVLTNKHVLNSRGAQFSILGIILTGIMVVFHHSFAARFVHFLSLIVYLGFLCQPQLKAAYHAILAALVQLVSLPESITLTLVSQKEKQTKFKRKWRWFKLIIIPIAIFWVFYIIFYNSNPVFSNISDTFWNAIGDFLSSIFENISFFWIIQFFVGMIVVALFLFRSHKTRLTEYEKGLKVDIKRNRKKRFRGLILMKWNSISLKNEYRSALILIGSINVLLLFVNAIDIHWIWFNFEYDPNFNLSQLVHEGTYLLILSILLSMGILLYFFRRNLNFFPNNVWLRRLANAWIFQNAILVISVIIRNYHYMYHYGLAYKRIGVMFFLIAVIVGLITLYIKINKAKTSFYLLKINGWAVYALLLILSCVNWDMVIVKHNIAYTSERNLDSEFLLSLSDKTLPVLYENRDKLNLIDTTFGGQTLENRIQKFMKRQRELSWKSWNYSDGKAFEYFDAKMQR